MADLQTGLSVTFEIAEQTIPLQSSLIQPETGETLKDAIQSALSEGLEFNIPPGQSVEVPLDEFIDWLADKGLTLPAGVGDLIEGTTVTITSLTISTSGKFNIALRIVFADGVIPDTLPLGDLIDITEMGLRLVHDPGP